MYTNPKIEQIFLFERMYPLWHVILWMSRFSSGISATPRDQKGGGTAWVFMKYWRCYSLSVRLLLCSWHSYYAWSTKNRPLHEAYFPDSWFQETSKPWPQWQLWSFSCRHENISAWCNLVFRQYCRRESKFSNSICNHPPYVYFRTIKSWLVRIRNKCRQGEEVSCVSRQVHWRYCIQY